MCDGVYVTVFMYNDDNDDDDDVCEREKERNMVYVCDSVFVCSVCVMVCMYI